MAAPGILGLDPMVFNDLNMVQQIPGQPPFDPSQFDPAIVSVLLDPKDDQKSPATGPNMEPWFPPGYVQQPMQNVWMPPARQNQTWVPPSAQYRW